MKQYRKIIKLELDFMINELKTLHKMKKINDDLDKSENNNRIT
jgi:hypothetical protein